jgi:hypothetical protein
VYVVSETAQVELEKGTSVSPCHPPPTTMAHSRTTCGCLAADDQSAPTMRSPNASSTTITAPAAMPANHMFIAACGAALRARYKCTL